MAAPPSEPSAHGVELAAFSSVPLQWRSSLAAPTAADCSRWPDDTGHFLWREAALALVQLMCANPGLCRGRAVLELAAGCAVPAAAAAALGARLVLATDAAEATLPLASSNVAANIGAGPADSDDLEEEKEREGDAGEEAGGGTEVGRGAGKVAAVSTAAAAGGEDPAACAHGPELPAPFSRTCWGVSTPLPRFTSIVGGILMPTSPALLSAASTAPSSPTLTAAGAPSSPLFSPVALDTAATTVATAAPAAAAIVALPPLFIPSPAPALASMPPPPPSPPPSPYPYAARLVWNSEADAAAVLARCGRSFDVVLATDALWLRPYSEDTITKQALELFSAALKLARPGGGAACRAAVPGSGWRWSRCCPLILLSMERRQAGVGSDTRRAAAALGLAFAVLDARGVKDAATFEDGGATYGAPAGARGASEGCGRGYWARVTSPARALHAIATH